MSHTEPIYLQKFWLVVSAVDFTVSSVEDITGSLFVETIPRKINLGNLLPSFTMVDVVVVVVWVVGLKSFWSQDGCET